MSTEHPITPPRELVEQWSNVTAYDQPVIDNWVTIATQAARWGADQELEACEKWLSARTGFMDSHDLHNARRPKPPSLKQQALALIDGCTDPHGDHLDDAALDTIRRALEALPDD